MRRSGGTALVSAHRCCGRGSSPAARRCLDIAGYVLSAAVLALLPKCPACIAIYLALGAGIGIAISTAAYLRMMLLFLSLAWLAYGAAKHVWRWKARCFEVR